MDPPSYAEGRYKDGLECARRATLYDQQKDYSPALTFYCEAVEALNESCDLDPSYTHILPRVQDYTTRAHQIREYLATRGDTERRSFKRSSSKESDAMRQLEYLIEVALCLDEEKRYNEAEKTYTSSVQMAIQMQELLSSGSDKRKVTKLTQQAVERLEEIQKLKVATTGSGKGSKLSEIPDPPKGSPLSSEEEEEEEDKRPAKPAKQQQQSALPRMPLVSFLDADKVSKFDAYSSPSSSLSSTGGGGAKPGGGGGASGRSPPGRNKDGLSEKEMKILKVNSKINGVVYLPWNDSDLSELRTVSALPMDYVDPDGLPRLAEKQKARLAGWQRPGEICDNPKMCHLISSLSIKQTMIGDCSFVASLGVCADYERRFKRKLITSCIFPQNRHKEPIINPNGKYLIKLFLNGCRRKVVIDDLLPVDGYSNILGSYSNSRDEFWVSLLEKAYMKVMGGYDFPGSSSNNDLHALTGWIPERIDIKESNKDKTFKMLEAKLKAGSALVTMGTGPLTKEESERTGLVPTHAYAVLRVTETCGVRLLQLKNPWSEKRWKGSFSERDTTNWTPELKKALNYDQSLALQVDNGVFWIDWTAVCRFYDTLYMNWDPEMFHHKYTIHDCWAPGEVEKDLYNISNNPQYSLTVNVPENGGTTWILLSRHITTKSDFAKNEKFITLHVVSSNGHRQYLPPDKYVHMGVKINTPHYLVKLNGLSHGSHTYTVIVSQLESLSQIYYTIKVYSTCKFVFRPVPAVYSQSKELRGQWKVNNPRPSFKLTVISNTAAVMVQIKGPRKYGVWIGVHSATQSYHKDTGVARRGFNVLQLGTVLAGDYIVTVATYPEGQEGPFFIKVCTDGAFNLEPNS